MDRLQHPLFARGFARAVGGMDRRGAAEHRRSILSGLQGTVIEVGAGAGSSFALYPSTVPKSWPWNPMIIFGALHKKP